MSSSLALSMRSDAFTVVDPPPLSPLPPTLLLLELQSAVGVLWTVSLFASNAASAGESGNEKEREESEGGRRKREEENERE